MKKCVFVIFLLAIMLFPFSACGGNDDESTYTDGNDSALSDHNVPPILDSEQVEQPVQEVTGGIVHQFDYLGFSVEFPAFWEGKYGMEKLAYFEPGLRLVAIYHLGSAEFGGVLFRLGRAMGEHFTYDYPPFPAGGSIFLAQTGGYTYFINFPSDVQHNHLEPNSESVIEYRKMAGPWGEPGHWDFLIDSFRLID